jgi:hypothetical protein
MKRIVFMLILFPLCSVLFAQDSAGAEQPAYDRLLYGLGLAGGGATAYIGPLPSGNAGLSFQQWFGRLGYQASISVSYPAMLSDPAALTITTGLQIWASGEVMGRLLAAQFSNWFFSELHLYGGIDHTGFMDATSWSSYMANFIVSAGFGIQAGLFQHFVFTLELGYGVSVPQFWIGLVVHGGFHYRF